MSILMLPLHIIFRQCATLTSSSLTPPHRFLHDCVTATMKNVDTGESMRVALWIDKKVALALPFEMSTSRTSTHFLMPLI